MAKNKEISDTAPLWWELQNIPTEIVRELRRRSNTNNIGFAIPSPLTNVTYNFDQIYTQEPYGYRGPMTPWVRVFSNSTGKTINAMVPRSIYLEKNNYPVDYDGFILKGGEGFYDAFGYDNKLGFYQSEAIIGYQANGKPHYIDGMWRSHTAYSTRNEAAFPQNNQTSNVLPPPGIGKISIKQAKDNLSYATVNFKCYGLAQLEYLTPFFLTAGINVFIEFGWNLFNQKSLIDLSKEDQCWELVEKPQTAFDRANKSYGNYGCISGIINKYSFNTTDGFLYDCTMEVISRQQLFAGMRTDNNAKISTPSNTQGVNFDREFLDLKTFFKTYLTDINEVLKQNQTASPDNNNSKSNFLNYIIDKLEKTTPSNNKVEADAAANAQQAFISQDLPELLEASVANVFNIIENVQQNSNSSLFYDGKPEDRAFIGRFENIYKAKKRVGVEGVINYDTTTVTTGSVSFTQVSDADEKTDFDAEDANDDVWLQLDFVFELINLFMANSKTKQNYVDISDVIINAHPNLISCDSNVLIPNPVAPKINIGVLYKKGSSDGGFLKGEDIFTQEQKTVTEYGIPVPYSETGNAFLSQQPDMVVKRNLELEKKLKLARENGDLKEFYKNLTAEEGFYFACEAARKTFKTRGRIRDNLDMVINYLHYHSVNQNLAKGKSAAFPFDRDVVITKQMPIPLEPIKTTYKKYYYGYLKHLYISKRKLIQIADSEETKNYKQFINAILNALNLATENFWKFDIVEGKDKNGKSVISIVDKNVSNFDDLKQIYTFEMGSTRNVIKSIDFNVSLSPEQAVNVQYAGSNSSLNTLKDKFTESITVAKTAQDIDATLNDLNKIPFIKFADRMDLYQLRRLAEEQKTQMSTISTVPGTTSGIEDTNNAIETLQKYGNHSNVLCMCVRQLTKDYLPYLDKVIKGDIIPNKTEFVRTGGGEYKEITKGAVFDDYVNELKRTRRNYKYLCLPTELRGKLVQMLDDGDYRHNSSKYSGVADNFSIILKFDGIFSFKNLQVFAINNLPKPYVPGNVVFQITEVEHEISAGKWETVVTALVRCVGSNQLEYILV